MPQSRPTKPSANAPATFSEAELLATRPDLLNYTKKLCGNPDLADDLVQEAYLRALANAHQFRAGSNLIDRVAPLVGRNARLQPRLFIHRLEA